MGITRIWKPRKALMVLGCLLALSVGLITGPASAQASTSSYCGGTLGVGGYCLGAYRWLYQAYGWGDQGGVCVGVFEATVRACTTAANTGVYSPATVNNVWERPIIWNYFNGSNFVHGVALTH